MKSSRRRAREFVLQGLYQWLLAGGDVDAIRQQLSEAGGFAKCDQRLFDRLWTGITGDYDAVVASFAPFLDREVKSLSPVERSILAIGAWELVREPDLPYRVALNEAIELAKSFGGTDGHKYVNGVLDKLAARVRPAEVAPARAAT